MLNFISMWQIVQHDFTKMKDMPPSISVTQ